MGLGFRREIVTRYESDKQSRFQNHEPCEIYTDKWVGGRLSLKCWGTESSNEKQMSLREAQRRKNQETEVKEVNKE